MFSSLTALTGSQAESQAPIQGLRRATPDGTRHRRAAAEETYWAYSGVCLYFFLCGELSVVSRHCGKVGKLDTLYLKRTGQLQEKLCIGDINIILTFSFLSLATETALSLGSD